MKVKILGSEKRKLAESRSRVYWSNATQLDEVDGLFTELGHRLARPRPRPDSPTLSLSEAASVNNQSFLTLPGYAAGRLGRPKKMGFALIFG